LLPERLHNTPMIGLGVRAAVTAEAGQRAEVWGLPRRSAKTPKLNHVPGKVDG
jgi:hypothetical protein